MGSPEQQQMPYGLTPVGLQMPSLQIQQPQIGTGVPNYDFQTADGGVIAPSGGHEYQHSGVVEMIPQTPFVFYAEQKESPEAPAVEAPAAATKTRDAGLKKKKKKFGCC